MLGVEHASRKAEFLKGTLDMLIPKVVAAGLIHGYAISQRIQQVSRDFFQGSLRVRCTRPPSPGGAWLARRGVERHRHRA